VSEHGHHRQAEPVAGEPADGDRDDVLREEQEGKGYGAGGEEREAAEEQ
jgi:hypothetical protein